MGFKIYDFKLAPGFSGEELKERIKKKIKSGDFSYTIEKQSLDARDKKNIFWLVKVGVSSPALRGENKERQHHPDATLHIPYRQRTKKVVVVGSGPAGFFCAYVLLLAGYPVKIIERGSPVDMRLQRVAAFESSGILNETDNYAFGEGGAGTFSDGKLTSRTKSISVERNFIFNTYIEAGAPAEIAYLAHPHLGSDNLVRIAARLRGKFLERGGSFLFNTQVTGIDLRDGRVCAVETQQGPIEGDYFVFACGHSAYDTYRFLISKGIPFQVKPFAIGCRVEHPQEIINQAQWGRASLPGVKAAEYRLTYQPGPTAAPGLPVYSFCMCPGGQVVPAAPFAGLNIVNGKSDYARCLPLANAAVVAAFDLQRQLGKTVDPMEALDWLEALERKFFDVSRSYAAPAVRIADFTAAKISQTLPLSSYPFALFPADLNALFPPPAADSLLAGCLDFNRKLKGFDQGIMLGLESKTSSPIQAVREPGGRSAAADNLYICGEGSGWAGGIVSSAADGIKTALSIAQCGAQQ